MNPVNPFRNDAGSGLQFTTLTFKGLLSPVELDVKERTKRNINKKRNCEEMQCSTDRDELNNIL